MGQYDSERTRVTQISREGRDGPARPGEACIIVIYGPELGKRLQLGTAAFEIGRSARCDLPIDQESVSRHHARITFDGKEYWIQDLGSTNGTFVNSEQIKQAVRLGKGDLLQIGSTVFQVSR